MTALCSGARVPQQLFPVGDQQEPAVARARDVLTEHLHGPDQVPEVDDGRLAVRLGPADQVLQLVPAVTRMRRDLAALDGGGGGLEDDTRIALGQILVHRKSSSCCRNGRKL